MIGLSESELKLVRMSVPTTPLTEPLDYVIAVQKATMDALLEKNR